MASLLSIHISSGEIEAKRRANKCEKKTKHSFGRRSLNKCRLSKSFYTLFIQWHTTFNFRVIVFNVNLLFPSQRGSGGGLEQELPAGLHVPAQHQSDHVPAL